MVPWGIGHFGITTDWTAVISHINSPLEYSRTLSVKIVQIYRVSMLCGLRLKICANFTVGRKHPILIRSRVESYNIPLTSNTF